MTLVSGGRLAVVAILTMVVAVLAMLLSRVDSTIALIWPVNAVVVGMMLWRNAALARAFMRLGAAMAGLTAANIVFGHGWTSLGFVAANAVECVIVFVALRALRAILMRDPEQTGYLFLCVAAAALGPAASAIFASLFLSVVAGGGGADFFLEWYLSDLLGLIVFLPPILLLPTLRVDDRLRTGAWSLAGASCGLCIGIGMGHSVAVLSILVAFPLAFGLFIFAGQIPSLVFFAALLATRIADLVLFERAPPIDLTGVAALDMQVVIAFISLSTLLAALVSQAHGRAKSQRDEALVRLERETRIATALRSAIAQASDAVVLFDNEDRLVDFNEQYRRLYRNSASMIRRGERFEDILRYGLKHNEYIDAEGREEEWLRERLTAHLSPASELEQRLADGRWIQVREFALEDGGRVGFRVDITERKQLEQDLRDKTERAELAVQAKDRFLATMSHELRTPMNGVLGMAQAVLQSDLTATQRRMVEVITDSGFSLMRLLNDLLDYARIESGEMVWELKSFVPAALVTTQYELFSATAAAKGIDLRLELGEGTEAPLLADQGRLGQMISNLLSNAIKFTEAGDIVLSAGLRPATAPGRAVLDIAVADSGPGVPAGERDRIFDRFEQTSDGKALGGAGLGLAICRGVCEMHRGTIRCRPRTGGGAVFEVALTLDHAIEAQGADTGAVAAKPARRRADAG